LKRKWKQGNKEKERFTGMKRGNERLKKEEKEIN
jgi:hypothetical protein